MSPLPVPGLGAGADLWHSGKHFLPKLYAAESIPIRSVPERPMNAFLLASLICIGSAFALRLIFAFAGDSRRR